MSTFVDKTQHCPSLSTFGLIQFYHKLCVYRTCVHAGIHTMSSAPNAETISLYTAILEAQVEAHGKDNPILAFTKMKLGTLQRQGRDSNWEKQFKECLKVVTCNDTAKVSALRLETQMQIVASYTDNLIQDKRFGTALEYLPIQNSYNAKTFSPKSFIYIDGMLQTAEAHSKTGNPRKAIDTVTTVKQNMSRSSPQWVRLSAIFEECKSLLREPLTMETIAPYNPAVNELFIETKEFIAQNKVEEAIANTLKTIEALDITYSKSDPLALQSNLQLAKLYLQTNNLEFAVQQLKVFLGNRLTQSTTDGFDAICQQCILKLYATNKKNLIDELNQTLTQTSKPCVQELLRTAVNSAG